MKNNVIVFAAHPDDEVLGCGGTILKHVSDGDNVTVVFISDGESSRVIKEDSIEARCTAARKASNILGCNQPIFLNLSDNMLDTYPLLEIIKKIEEIILKFEPNIVYTHYYNDLNIDHQITCRSVLTACRPLPNSLINSILLFETPSSTEWGETRDIFVPQKFVNISDFIKVKRKALEAYKDEMRDFPHPRSYKAIEAIDSFRGATAGYNSAEAFEIYRKILK